MGNQYGCQWNYYSACGTSASENRVDKRTPNTAIAIYEWVYRLKLRMCDSSLGQNRNVISV